MTDILNNTTNTYAYTSLRYWCENCRRNFSQLNVDSSGPSYARCPRCNLYADPTPQSPQSTQSNIPSTPRASQPTQPTQPTRNTSNNRNQNTPFSYYTQTFADPFGRVFAQTFPTGATQGSSNSNSTNNMFSQLFGGLFQGGSNPTMSTSNFGPFEEEIDPAVLEQFLRDDPNQYGPPPAPQDAMNRLQEVRYDPNREGGVEITCCPICQEDYTEGESLVRLPCNHEYHRGCVNEWLSQHNSCPMCREAI